eukprot:6328482-Prymnesium_polylepis.1
MSPVLKLHAMAQRAKEAGLIVKQQRGMRAQQALDRRVLHLVRAVCVEPLEIGAAESAERAEPTVGQPPTAIERELAQPAESRSDGLDRIVGEGDEVALRRRR